MFIIVSQYQPMKKNLFFSLFAALLLLVSCKGFRGNFAIGENNALDDIVVDSDHIVFKKKNLNGGWARSQNDDPLFHIVNDTLLFAQNKTYPIKIKLEDHTVTVYGTLEFTCTIVKLNQDSLCYIDDITSELTRLTRKM